VGTRIFSDGGDKYVVDVVYSSMPSCPTWQSLRRTSGTCQGLYCCRLL